MYFGLHLLFFIAFTRNNFVAMNSDGHKLEDGSVKGENEGHVTIFEKTLNYGRESKVKQGDENNVKKTAKRDRIKENSNDKNTEKESKEQKNNKNSTDDKNEAGTGLNSLKKQRSARGSRDNLAKLSRSSSKEKISGRISRSSSRNKLKFDPSMSFENLAEEEESSLSGEDEIDVFDMSGGFKGYQRLYAMKGEGDDVQYYAKLKGKSFRSCIWVPEFQIKQEVNGAKLIKSYLQNRYVVDPEYEVPDKVLFKKVVNGVTYYLVKWRKLGYDENTWETRETLKDDSLIEKYEEENKLPPLAQLVNPPKPSPSEWEPVDDIPKSKQGFSVRPYQLDGINFIIKNWFKGVNCILADEMGLGKTFQSLAFLDYLFRVRKIRGPFLCVGPLATVSHWEREVHKWTNMKSVVYTGDKTNRTKRSQIAQFEMFYPNTNYTKFNVLLTTYEYIISDIDVFKGIEWDVMVVDEAHRLKNDKSKLCSILKKYNTKYKLLLTGTPLQNNIQEFWSLLNFLDPVKFSNMEEFVKEFGEMSDQAQVKKLRKIIDPLMLRRLKNEVEKIPPLEEIIIECPMTMHQKGYTKSILNKNLDYLSRGAHKKTGVNLNNIATELRKVCNHPYLIDGAENQIVIELRDMDKIAQDDDLPLDYLEKALIRTSGKMILLNKLLDKLKQDGHRVLIFSQFARMLNILQDHLEYKRYSFERIDGNIRGEDRQASIDRFNSPDSEVFAFLLTTKAGGQGINLTTADTVIIYDSDWNPQNDLQATARCHRIGQQKSVKVYRLITSNSYEYKMFQTASKKLGLDQAVLESSKNPKNQDVEKLLMYGAYHAFEDKDDDEIERYREEDIDSIIGRSQKITHENVGAGDGSTFSKAYFVLDEDQNFDVTDPDFWKKYLPQVPDDDIGEGLSIAERNALRKKTESDLLTNIEEHYTPVSVSTDFVWSKKKIQILMKNLIRFGWGRWRAIYNNSHFNCDKDEVKAVSHVILQWLLDECPGKFSVIEHLNRTYNNEDDIRKLASKFLKSHSSFKSVVTLNAEIRLLRLELLYFLISSIQGCSNPPDGLVIPYIPNLQKPAEWWTSADDKLLLHGVYEYGYGNYEKIQFTDEVRAKSINSKLLTARLKALVNGLKNMFSTYSSEKRVQVLFNYETLKKIQEEITKNDHKKIINTLTNFGFTTLDEFINVAGLAHKNQDVVGKYVRRLTTYSLDLAEKKDVEEREIKRKRERERKKLQGNQSADISVQQDDKENNSEDEIEAIIKIEEMDDDHRELEEAKFEAPLSRESPLDAPWLAEKILPGTAQKISQRKRFFTKARAFCDNPTISEKDKELINFTAERGFLEPSFPESYKMFFPDEEVTEGKILKRVRDIAKIKVEKPPRPRPQSHDTTFDPDKPIKAPDIEIDEDGNPIYPIRLGQSAFLDALGTVVYDRPGFHCNRYIYPAGYISRRYYTSVVDPTEKTWYKNYIIDNGGEEPLFRVEVLDNPDVFFEGPKPSTPWIGVITAIEKQVKSNRKLTISGPDYYNLTSPVVLKLMSTMENADKCLKFKQRNFGTGETKSDNRSENASEESPKSAKKQKVYPTPVRRSARLRKIREAFISDYDDNDRDSLNRQSDSEFGHSDNNDSD